MVASVQRLRVPPETGWPLPLHMLFLTINECH